MNVVRTPRMPDISDETKRAEFEFATAVTCHCAVRAVDHLGEMIVRRSKGTTSCLANMKLHRTKCSGLIKNVISPAIKCEVIEEAAEKKVCKYCGRISRFNMPQEYVHYAAIFQFSCKSHCH